MAKKILYGCAILAVIISVQGIYDKKHREENTSPVVSEVIENVFTKEGISENECIIDGYYYYGSMYLSDEGCHEVLDKLAGRLGVSSYEYYRNRTNSGYVATLKKESDSSTLSIQLITAENNVGENIINQQQYISINLCIENSVESGFYYCNLIDESVNVILKQADARERVLADEASTVYTDEDEYRDYVKNLNISVKGKIYGVADLDRQKRISEELLDMAGAEKIFDNTDPVKKSDETFDMYSMYGYTKDIDDYVAVGSRKINVNVVFTYNEEENVTYVHFGSPIINYDY